MKRYPLNEFVEKILSGSIVGAVTSLRGVKEGWKEIETKIARQNAFEWSISK